MAGLIAVGLGCRKNCASAVIVSLARRALAQAGPLSGEARLFTAEIKRGAVNLEIAATELGLPLAFLDLELLQAQSARALTRSARVERIVGVPSLAETAALAGAGPGGALVVTRLTESGATCAVAYNEDGSP